MSEEKEFKFFACFKNGKTTDWIHIKDKSLNPAHCLSRLRQFNYVANDKGDLFFYIDWAEVQYAECRFN